MSDLPELQLPQIVEGLRSGQFSSRELTKAYLERIQNKNKFLHAFLTIADTQALIQADHADILLSAWRKGEIEGISPLLGIPLAVKDVLCVAGLLCTCGSLILENFVPTYNATVIERVQSAGMVILGKTNTDEFAMGSSTENSAFGPTRNPWSTDRVPGGSSGGSAAAVAARLAPIALGTDTGGSVRQPASFCGVTGIKPTYGRVSRYGLVAYGSSLDVVGAFGKSVVEVVMVFQQIAGHDYLDATSSKMPVGEINLGGAPEEIIRGLRIGVPKEYFIPGMQTEVEAAVQKAIQTYETYGAEIVLINMPHTGYALPVYYLIAPAEASANLARYDGIRYGPREEAHVIKDVFTKTRGKRFGAEVKRRIMLGTYALSAGYYDEYYRQAQKVRTLIKGDFEKVFQDVDIIAAPVAPTTAFRFGEHSGDPLAMYLEDVFTLPANLAGVPALAFPVGFDNQGLPIGMQLMGPPFMEDLLFRVAHAYQQITDWHLRKPSLVENLEI